MSRAAVVSGQPSNGSAITGLGVCLICDRECLLGQYVVYSRPTIGANQTPFFPILESLHGTNSSAQINCCRLCCQSLISQWNDFESKQIPIKNRVYYLNNTTKPVVISKTEANHSLHTNHHKKHEKHGNHNNSNNSSNASAEEVLDLSLTSTSAPNLAPYSRPNIRGESNGTVKHMSNRYPHVCYICGEDCHSVVNVLVRPTANCPYFPSLLSHPKPNGANPIDSSGRIDSCDLCHRFLLQQWDHFQRLNVPIVDRHYSLRNVSTNESRSRGNRYSCALCNTELSQSLHNVVISILTVSDSTSELKKLVLSSAQEFIIGSGIPLDLGKVLTCIGCFRELIKNGDPLPPLIQTSAQVLDTKRKYLTESLNNSISDQQLCPLCNKVRNQIIAVQSTPSTDRKPFFPFLKDVVKPQEVDSLGRIRVCNICVASLESQWDAFESALIPHSQRDYLLASRRSPFDRSLSPPPLKIQVSSPPPLQQSFICEPLLTTVTTPTHNTYSMTSSSKHYITKNESKITGPMDEMLSALGGPLLKAANCMICSEYSSAGHTYQLYATPRNPPIISHELGIYPFFPFLKKHIAINTSSNNDDRDRDLESRSNSALVCTFCYHSLIGQWIAYNASPFIEDKDPMRRTYNYRDYICFICGVTTFRQRSRSISLKDFPFLLEHSRPSGALTLTDGENVVTCLTCFDSLTLQWKDYERMKVPIEMRKYNWITVAPPNRDINEYPMPLVHNHLSETLSPTSGVTALSPHGAVVPMIAMSSNAEDYHNLISSNIRFFDCNRFWICTNYHNLISSSNLAKTRTSTFAAALRKLAKQTSDSLIATDSGSAPHSIPYGLSVAHSSNLSKNSNNSSFQSPYQSSAIRQSPPIVTIAPIPAHQIDRSESDNQLRNHLRKSDNQFYYEHRIHTDPKESLIYSHSQRTSPIVQVRPSPSHVHNDSLNSVGIHSTQQNNVTNRMPGFQPYRSGLEDSLRNNSSTSLASAPLPSHLLPYDAMAFPYHPFLPHTNPNPLPHHAPHPSASYRMGDPYYMDRFGLLRGQLHVPSAPLPMAGSGTTSSVPFNLVRYSELLNSQTERLINDERQRLLNQTLSQSAQTSYKPNTQTIDSPPIHMTNNNEKYGNNSEHFIMNHSMKNHSTSGSILSGTPRDVTPLSGSVGNGIRKPNGPNMSTNRPLNLSSDNEQHILEQKYLWRPQSDGQTDHNSFNPSNRLMELNIHLQNKDSVLAEDKY
ncbi:unnamed protein product [Medioppia subpectinata]|uniref:Uncharacterized protein n=1 Tax=Medioppia subpectinata TaxID=1979941 RepID=A0A7R9Q569_9ACAR|nr:unnamed protein product [Medioppia subpectinata]CAG2113453.1 unnamed protein product [Medioppia subpectinata]